MALLRYLANQYSAHLSKLDAVESSIIEIRKFYMAYELCGDDASKQSELLSSFISISTPLAERAGNNFSGPGDSYKKIFEDILDIIKKKT